MAFQPKLVNKQFNSPIGLYSEDNVREILDRETQILANGAVGINFHNPMVGKPANLHNSAVLRMLEEEESKQRNGSHGFEKPLLEWPPPGVTNRPKLFKDVVISGSDHDTTSACKTKRSTRLLSYRFSSCKGVKRVAWPPPKEGEDFFEQAPVQAQGGAQYSSQTTRPGLQNFNNNQQPNVEIISQSPVDKPISPNIINQRAGGFAPAVARPWASVQSPPSPQPQYQSPASPLQPPEQEQIISHPNFQQTRSNFEQLKPKPQPNQFQQAQTNQYQQSNQNQQQFVNQYQQQQQQPRSPVPYQSGVYSQQQGIQSPEYRPVPPPIKQVEPPPTLITLRPKVPISQAPAPVFQSQPATATLRGGKNLRGDLKWPPENVKDRMENENRLRMELAQGPAVRPRRVNKDYSTFFAQHALNSTYPGYKVPPGTQFYEHHPVM